MGNDALSSIVNTGSKTLFGGCRGESQALACSYVGPTEGSTFSLEMTSLGKETCATSEDFLAGSIGKLRSNDKWTIDQTKRITNIKNGLN